MDEGSRKVIQFKPKEEFILMWPSDWEDEFCPSMYEIEHTLKTIKAYKNMLLDEIATSGVSSEFEIRKGLDQLDSMHSMIMHYLRVN